MSDLIDTTEMYLKAIYELIEDGVVPMRARIAERLDHSGPTVSQTVARMERDGLLHVEQDRQLTFTDLGRQRATRVMRKHRLAERLLVDVIGLDPAYVHDEACRWEHVMSERVESRILVLIEDATRSPYGNPIPGLEELGWHGEAVSATGVSVADALASGLRALQIVRIGEPAQVEPESLEVLLANGVVPGARVEVGADGDRIRICASDHEAISVPHEVATHLFASTVF
ncbi:MAG: iron dependent repressor, metal binding and dimerization domain protein [Ornithinimicrobium sp.]